jgi:hypothetical protein
MDENVELDEIQEQDDSTSLAEIELFFRMAIELEQNKFNLYPRDAEEMQLKLINLVKQRLDWFEYE